MTPAEILTRARALIEKPEAWTQGALAKTARGNIIGSLCPGASCFCALGAIERAANKLNYDAWRYLRAAIGDRVVPEWNDDPGTTHAEVLDAFSRAIELARAGDGE